jgi:hypothetical protein
MAFPTNGFLTTFPGGDEDPISEGGNWDGPISVGKGELALISNRLGDGSTGAASRSSYWTPNTFTESEIFATVTARGSSNGQWFALTARISSPGAAEHGSYSVVPTVGAGTDIIEVYRTINDTATLVDNLAPLELVITDGIGLEVLGVEGTVTLNVYHSPLESGYVLHDSFIDTDASRIVTGGFIGIEMSNGTTWRLGEFGGGEVESEEDNFDFGMIGRGSA